MQRIFFNIKLITDTATLLLLLGLFAAQLPLTIATSYLLCVVLSIIAYAKIRINNKKIELYALVLFLLFIPVLTFNHGITPFFYLLASPFLFLIAYELSSNSLNHIQAVIRSTYWIFFIFIFCELVIHRDEPEPLGAILPWVSTNGIPSYLIVIQIAYSLLHYLKFNRLPILSAGATMVVAVFGLGRGSMVIAFLILLLSFLINICVIKSKKDKSMALKIFFIIVFPVVFFVASNIGEIIDGIELMIEGSKFSGGILDEHRGLIISDYINKIDGFRLIFGTDYENTSINDWYGGNPHNSFIRVHSFYGIFGLIFVFFPVIAILISRKNSVQKFVFMVFIILALLRAVSEPIFFPSTLDFFYFLIFFVFFRFSKNN